MIQPPSPPYKAKIIVALEMPSVNKVNSWVYHPQAKWHYAKFKKDLMLLIQDAPADWKAKRKMSIVISLYRWQKITDKDNTGGTCIKALLDTLKKKHWIQDDSETWITTEVKQYVDRKSRRTEVVITPEKNKD